MINSLQRSARALFAYKSGSRWMTGAVSVSLVVALLDVAATPTLAYRSTSMAPVDITADDSNSPAPLEVLVPSDATPTAPSADDAGAQPAGDDTSAQPAGDDVSPQPGGDDTAGQPAADQVDPCVAPYDRPELACALPAGALTSGSVSPATSMSVYRYDATLPGTIIQAQLTQGSAQLALFLVGPGDKVLSKSDAGSDAPKVVGASVLVPGTHAIYVVADPGASGAAGASYTLQFQVQPPVASGDVPLLPGSDPASQQCPQARIEAEDTFFTRFMTIFELPCETCTVAPTGAAAKNITSAPATTSPASHPLTTAPATTVPRLPGGMAGAAQGSGNTSTRSLSVTVSNPVAATSGGASSTSGGTTTAQSDTQPSSSGSAGQANAQTGSSTSSSSGSAQSATTSASSGGTQQSAGAGAISGTNPSTNGAAQPPAPGPQPGQANVPAVQSPSGQAASVNGQPAAASGSRAGSSGPTTQANTNAATGQSATVTAVQGATQPGTASSAPAGPGAQAPQSADAGAPDQPASPAQSC